MGGEASPISLSIYGGALFLLTVLYLLVRWCWWLQYPASLPRFHPSAPQSPPQSASSAARTEILLDYKYGKLRLGEESSCPVCLCDFREGEDVRDLPVCRHSFHVPCIDMWLRTHSTCPLCRVTALPSGRPPDSGIGPESSGR